MKKIIWLVVLCYYGFNVHILMAQDKIIKRNGEVIECKIKEIETNTIKYTIEDFGDILFDIEKRLVDKMIFANGREIVIDHAARASQNTETNSEDLFLVQRKLALKTELLSPIWGSTSFIFEKAIRPGRSWEAGISIIGLGFDNPDNAFGFAFRGSYKFLRSPDHYLEGMRYAHILKGSYLKPEFALAAYSGSYTGQDYDRLKFAILFVIGKQTVYSNSLVLDTYAGLGYGYTNSETFDSGDMEFPYVFTVLDKSIPLAFTWGFRIGLLLGKKYVPGN